MANDGVKDAVREIKLEWVDYSMRALRFPVGSQDRRFWEGKAGSLQFSLEALERGGVAVGALT